MYMRTPPRSLSVPSALPTAWTLLDTTHSHANVGVMLSHTTMHSGITLLRFLHHAHALVQAEACAGFFPDHLQSRLADILAQNCDLVKPVALVIIVVSLLNPLTLPEDGAMVGAVLEARESRKQQANNDKSLALGWVGLNPSSS